MIQLLTNEGREFVAAQVDGRRYAFVSVIGKEHTAALALAIEGVAGETAIPEQFAHADGLRPMQLHADRLNVLAGVNKREAARIVASTWQEAA